MRIETVRGGGTGTLISPDGFVLTAAHVVGDAKKVRVVLLDESVYEGGVVARNVGGDVALVRIDASDMPCIPVASSRAATGADLFLIGSPAGETLTHSVTKGVVSGYRETEGVDVLQTDAGLSPGYSSGPVLSTDGSIQGVTSFKVVGQAVEGLGFAAAVDDALRALTVEFGDASDTEFAAPVDEGSVGRQVVEISNRPAQPGPPITKKPCKGVDIEVGSDAFSGTETVTAVGADLFEIRYVAGQGGKFILKFPMRAGLYGINSEALDQSTYTAPAEVDFKLEDGTLVHLVGMDLPKQHIQGFGAFISSDFPLTRELVEALASSGPLVERWTFGGDPKDFDRSKRQREKYFRPYFSCLLTHWED